MLSHLRQYPTSGWMTVACSIKGSQARKRENSPTQNWGKKIWVLSFPLPPPPPILQSCSFSSAHPWFSTSCRSHLILLNLALLSLKLELFGGTLAPPRPPPNDLRVAGARVHVLEPQHDLRRLDRARSFPPTPTNRRAQRAGPRGTNYGIIAPLIVCLNFNDPG